jgi:hypothetical protein
VGVLKSKQENLTFQVREVGLTQYFRSFGRFSD